jgi:ribosomal protein S18 acetylase RimI-like enzyme
MPIAEIRGSDAIAVRAFLTRLSPETRRGRYLVTTVFHRHSLEREVRRLQSTVSAGHTVLLAREGGEVRGIGEYVVGTVDRTTAEVAVVVEDGYQHRGIGTSLFLNLEKHALGCGIRAFTGEVANDNYRVLRLLKAAGRPLEVQAAYASSPFQIVLRQGSQELAA